MFKPIGSSSKISLNGGVSQVAAIPPGAAAVRLVATKYPSSSFAYINIGDSSVSVSVSNGMPVNFDNKADIIVPVGIETHIAVIMGAGSAFDIMLTPGEVV